jgi:hypothetical protein
VDPDALSVSAEVFSAVGTVGAVVVALFLQYFNVRRARPRLSVEFSDRLHDEDMALVDLEHPSLFVRLKVRAEAGKDVARNVQVLLLRVDRPTRTLPAPVVPSRNLKWADTPNEKLDIPPGIWRRFDFLTLWVEPPGGGGHCLVPMLYQYDEPWPPHPRNFLRDTGRYRMALAVVADNTDSTFWQVDLDYAPGPVAEIADLCRQLRVVGVARTEGEPARLAA